MRPSRRLPPAPPPGTRRRETVDRHVHGTGLTGVLPGSWDHPIATDGTTRRVVPGGRVVAGFGSIHVERCGDPVWRFGRLM